MRRKHSEWPKMVHSVSNFRNLRLLRSSNRDMDFLKWPLVLRVFQHRWLLSRPSAFASPAWEPLCSAPRKDGEVRFCPAVGAWRWSPAAIVAVLRFRGALAGPIQKSAILKHVWGVRVGELGVAHNNNNPASFSYPRGHSVGLQMPCGLQLSYGVDPGV